MDLSGVSWSNVEQVDWGSFGTRIVGRATRKFSACAGPPRLHVMVEHYDEIADADWLPGLLEKEEQKRQRRSSMAVLT